MKDQPLEKQEKSPTPTPSMDNGKGANDTIRSNISNTVTHVETKGEELGKAGLKSAKEAFNALRNGDLKTTAAKAYETLKTAGEAKAEIKGLSGKISEDVMMPVIKILSKYKGTAIFPVAKHLDPVIGCDVHMVAMLPAPAPVPMPHLYIGIIFDPKDWVSILVNTFKKALTDKLVETVTDYSEKAGKMVVDNKEKALPLVMSTLKLNASVKIGSYIPRAVTGTKIKNVPHFPSGPVFHPAFMAAVQKNHGKVFLGSLFVLADGDPMAGCFHLNYDCWDIGIIDLYKFKRGKKGIKRPKAPAEGDSKMQLFAPTSTILAIPWARVLVNSIPTPFNPMQLPDKIFKTGLSKLKAARAKSKKLANIKNPKPCNRLSRSLNNLNNKIFGKSLLGKALSKNIGKYVGHPVDVASGRLFTDNEDFALPGQIPLVWERTWYSDSDYQGPLGHGWHHSYDIGLKVDKEAAFAAIRLADGRTGLFDQIPLNAGDNPRFNRTEKWWLCLHADGYYYARSNNGLLYNFTQQPCHARHNEYLLDSITNPNSFAIQFTYNYKGWLQKITDAGGRQLTVQNTVDGRIECIQVTHPQWNYLTVNLAAYTYNTEGNLTAHLDALKQPMHFEYMGTLLVQETWRNGLKFFFKYDGSKPGAKCIETWGDGNLLHYNLQYFDGRTLATDSLRHTSTYLHFNGLVHQTTDPNGAVWLQHHNQFDELQSTTDPLGNQHAWAHDDFGNLVNSTAPDGTFSDSEYFNPAYPWLPTGAMDELGGKWIWNYDTAGNLIKRSDPLGAITLFTYADGLLKKITNAAAVVTILHYDRQHNLNKIDYANYTAEYLGHDGWGNCIREVDVKDNVTDRSFDLLGRVVEIKLPTGNIQKLTYDAIDNVTIFKDNISEVEMSYTGLWKLNRRKEAGANITFVHDTEERLTRIINERGEAFRFIMDGAGNLTSEVGFDNETKTYQYDAAGRVIKVNRPAKRHTQYGYDQAGRVTEVSFQDGSRESYRYKNGMLAQATNDTINVQFERDITGRLISETSNGHTVTSAYNIMDQRTRIESSMGANISMDYDIMGEVQKHTANGWQAIFKRDEFGQEINKELTGGIISNQRRDRFGRVTQHIVNNSVSTQIKRPTHYRNYSWDTHNRLQNINDQRTGSTNFQYDKWSNLSKTIFTDGSQQLRNPDASGNLFETENRRDRKYGAGSNLIESKNGSYKQDEEGNLIEKKLPNGDVWHYQWNAAGMLAKVTLPDKTAVTFTYDALGRRTEKRYKKTITKWVWDGNKPLHEWKEFDFKETTPDDLITWVFEEDSFAPAAKIKGDKKCSLVCDHLGTPTQGYNEEGALIWERQLDSYGKIKMLQGDEGFCNYLYQGQTLDAETGLAYNRFRYYDPEEGVYISQDPIGLDGGMALYGYVKDTNIWVDILGLDGGKTSFIGGALHSGTVSPNNPGGVYTIKATGSYQGDKAALYGKANLKENFSPDYIGHHISYELETNTMKMQLVKQDVHSKVSHIGGVNDYREKHNGEGYKQSKKKTKTSCKS